jgi:hypothetical protein
MSVAPPDLQEDSDPKLSNTDDSKEVNRERETSKKRKQVSDAEKVALELSKLTCRQSQQSMLRFEDKKIFFLNPSRASAPPASCSWRDSRHWPCYCPKAEFSFEATLPDRFYLTRYSVSCDTCYPDQRPTFHLYCACCDEILAGSIAGPGGKITDHVITIRHVVQEARALQAVFDRGGAPEADEVERVQEYVSKLEHWSRTIRFPKNAVVKRELDAALGALRANVLKASERARERESERPGGGRAREGGFSAATCSRRASERDSRRA